MSSIAQPLRIAIIGSRSWTDEGAIYRYIGELRFCGVSVEVVSGGARGVDSIVENACHLERIPIKVFPANWTKYKKSAGFIRNSEIVSYADFCVAFWDGKSRGSADTIWKFQQKGKPTTIIPPRSRDDG